MAKETKKEKEIVEDLQEAATEIDEKQVLKEAEEREKAKKEEEKIAKAEAKEAQKEEEKKERAVKKAEKAHVRVKPRHGKKHRAMAEKIEAKEYPAAEALNLTLETSPAKFDATVEIHVKINKKEKNIRGMVSMPGGTAKEKKILEVTEKNVDDVIAQVKANKIDFDTMIADLKVMPKLTILAKVLGPKGLMPSPKAGTAVEDVAKAAEEIKGGKTEYKLDKNNVIHLPLGKVSFGFDKIKLNLDSILASLPVRKIDSIYLTTTMGPSIRVAKK